jgi:hypothetical protein
MARFFAEEMPEMDAIAAASIDLRNARREGRIGWTLLLLASSVFSPHS